MGKEAGSDEIIGARAANLSPLGFGPAPGTRGKSEEFGRNLERSCSRHRLQREQRQGFPARLIWLGPRKAHRAWPVLLPAGQWRRPSARA